MIQGHSRHWNCMIYQILRWCTHGNSLKFHLSLYLPSIIYLYFGSPSIIYLFILGPSIIYLLCVSSPTLVFFIEMYVRPKGHKMTPYPHVILGKIPYPLPISRHRAGRALSLKTYPIKPWFFGRTYLKILLSGLPGEIHLSPENSRLQYVYTS